MHQFARHRGGQRDPGCSDSLTRAAGTIRDVLDDLARLPVTVSRAEHSADILDRLAAELGEAAALLRKAAPGGEGGAGSASPQRLHAGADQHGHVRRPGSARDRA